MDNVNEMKIICDPYQKTIEYLWYDCNSDEYISPNKETSRLAHKDYTNTAIQNRAYEIADIICEDYCTGNIGLNILFTGTEDDYNDFCKVLNTYHSDAKITCVRDSFYYETAEKVMPKIKDEFYSIQAFFNDYSEDKIKDLIDRYSDTVKPSISLCVVGLYSAGKSAFINSIVGEELLPSASDPTTGRVCKITCDKNYKITFWYADTECTIEFNKNSYKSSASGDNEIISKLENTTKSYEIHNEIYYMNKTLKILNDYKNEDGKLDEFVEVTLPFKNSKLPIDEFDYVIYDTPGSNSTMNPNHFEILKKSLSEQTNALPIFVTNPDTMDSEDNKKVLSLIKETGEYLDTANAMIVVNKADEKAPRTLSEKKEKCHNLMISEWRSTSIFFVSSPIGIASKKENPDDESQWLDSDMQYLYNKNSDFANDKIKLYEYNIIDQSKADAVATNYSGDDKTAHLYKNSGLESIEKEIADYARKYALYNKCQKASEYLDEAIDLCVENIKETREKIGAELQKAKESFSEKEKNLIDKLENKKSDITQYTTEFEKQLEDIVNEYKKGNNLTDDKSSKKALSNELQTKWLEIKQDQKGKTYYYADSRMQWSVEKKHSEYIHNLMKIANKIIPDFWNKKTNSFRTECGKIIAENNYFTKEQREILMDMVMEENNVILKCSLFNLKEVGILKHGWFFTKKFKFDKNRCCNELVKRFNDEVRAGIVQCINSNKNRIEGWSIDFIATLQSKLCEFNHDLNDYSQEISTYQNSVQINKACEQRLNESKAYIEKLLTAQGDEYSE